MLRFGLIQALGIAALCAGIVSARAADDIAIRAHRQGDAVMVEARATLAVPRQLVWDTLTDYDQLASFVPGMRHSRVIERRASTVIVKQQGEAGFLFFTHAIDVVVEAQERPPHEISVRVLSGNLRQLDGRYQIEPDARRAGHYVLRWHGLIEPESRLPLLISVPILRSNISAQFRGLLREIERRAVAAAETKK